MIVKHGADGGDDRRPEAFADAFRAAVEARGVTLVWLRDRLSERGNRVSLSTLSYWRSGRSRPEGVSSRAALADLEELLGLEPRSLADRVGRPRRAGQLRKPVIPVADDAMRAAIEETFAGLGAARLQEHRDVSTHVVVVIDESGREKHRTFRTLVQAISGTITEIPYVETSPEPVEDGPRFTTLAGCRIARSHTHPNRQVFGVALALDDPLSAPGTALIELRQERPAGYPEEHSCWHGVVRQSKEILIWARFHPAKLPAWCEEYTVVDGREDVVRRGSIGPSVHAVRRDFGPGLLGLRWGF